MLKILINYYNDLLAIFLWVYLLSSRKLSSCQRIFVMFRLKIEITFEALLHCFAGAFCQVHFFLINFQLNLCESVLRGHHAAAQECNSQFANVMIIRSRQYLYVLVRSNFTEHGSESLSPPSGFTWIVTDFVCSWKIFKQLLFKRFCCSKFFYERWSGKSIV